MKRQRLTIALWLLACLVLLLMAVPALGQPAGKPETFTPQITGVPGSPSATTTISGKQLPPPDPKFGGVIKDTAAQSKPYWPPRVVPPKGAPNVLHIMTDVTGQYHRVIMVSQYENLAAYEKSLEDYANPSAEMKEMMKKMAGFQEMYTVGSREIYRTW